jgi:hypothetical protein
MQAGMESCPVKVVMAGGAGFVLGGAMGLFLSSVSRHCHVVYIVANVPGP